MPEAVPAATVVIGRESQAGFEVLLMQRPARGTFANAWAFPGGRIEPGESIREGAVREVHEEVGLTLDPDALVPLSRWIPPEQLKRRFDTSFFLAGDPGGDITPNPDEVVDWKWATPASVIEQHARGEATLVPPTFITLTVLSQFGSFADAVHHASEHGPETFRTQGVPEEGLIVAGRHRLTTSSLPWRYELG